MRATKIVLTIVLICFLQSLPVCGISDDLSEPNSEIYKILEAGRRGFDELCTEREPDLITNYADILANASNILKTEQQDLDKICIKMEPDLITKYANLLANDIASNNITSTEAKLKEIYNRYPKQIVESIFDKAFNKIVSKQSVLLLPDLLWSIYDVEYPELFKITLLAPKKLYKNVSEGQHVFKDEFLQSFSYILYKITQVEIDAGPTRSLKSSFKDIIKILPKHFRLLYFDPSFCLINVKYSYYIYTSDYDKWNSKGRGIWIWSPDKYMKIAANIKAEFIEVDPADRKKLKVTLQGTDYLPYYAIDPEDKMVLGLKTSLYGMWDIEHLDDDRVYFSQNELYMCAAEMMDNERRYVKGSYNKDSYCEWRLEKCDFTPPLIIL